MFWRGVQLLSSAQLEVKNLKRAAFSDVIESGVEELSGTVEK